MELKNNLPQSEYENREIIIPNNEPRKCKKCQGPLPIRYKLENGKILDCRRRVYCINCSPIGKRKMCGPDPKFHEKGTTNGDHQCHKIDRICKNCGKIYRQKTRNLECSVCRNKRIRAEHKKQYVNYKGNKCEKCGYDKCIGVLDFHHIDPHEKEITISGFLYKSLENMKSELDKCILLCSNCHRELHWKEKQE